MSETSISPKVVQILRAQSVDGRRHGGPGGIDNGGDGPHDGNMEARIAKLENFVVDAKERLTKIETRLEQTSTKADLHQGFGDMIKWVVGTGVVLGVAAITIMTFVLNNAVPKPTQSQPAPIIIQIPAAPTAAPTK